MKKIIPLLFVLSLSLLAEAQNKIAFIYGKEASSPNTFKTLLTNEGFTVDLIDSTSIASTNFSAYRLIVVSEKTFVFGISSVWDEPINVNAVSNANLLIVGMGGGGAMLFEKMGKWSTWGQSAGGDFSNLEIQSSTHPIFSTPKALTITNGVINTSNSSESVMPYLGDGIPADVSVLAKSSGNALYSELSLEDSKYFLWSANPHTDASELTTDGKNLFVNVVAYMLAQGIALEVQKGEPDTGISFYPNPAKEYVCVSGLTDVNKAEIFTLAGKQVAEQHDPEGKIDLRDLVPGMYLLKVYAGEKIYCTTIYK